MSGGDESSLGPVPPGGGGRDLFSERGVALHFLSAWEPEPGMTGARGDKGASGLRFHHSRIVMVFFVQDLVRVS